VSEPVNADVIEPEAAKIDTDIDSNAAEAASVTPEPAPELTENSASQPEPDETEQSKPEPGEHPEPVEHPAPVEQAEPVEPADPVRTTVPEPMTGFTRPPELPEEVDYGQLDPDVRAELRGLPKGLAELVGKHLVTAGMLIDSDPELALRHARYAREKAARVGVVREATGLTAYHAGEWAEALSELRAARRMSGGSGHIAVMADCERALGRPERAIELAKEGHPELSAAESAELRIVAAGARRDLGQIDAAVVALQGPELDPRQRSPWSARLFYAYADNLEAAGRTEESIRWFLNAAQADEDGETDAADRAVELAGKQGDSVIEADAEPATDAEPETEADAETP
jgi:hypothetical protein